MRNGKEYMEHILINVEDCSIHLYCNNGDIPKSIRDTLQVPDAKLIKEAGGNWKNLPGPYSCRVDQAHDAATGHRHIHIYKRENHFLSFNWDGSSHDGSAGRIPNRVYDFLNNRFPDLGLPDNRVIEAVDLTRMIKFSQYFVLRNDYKDAMEQLNEAIVLAEGFCS